MTNIRRPLSVGVILLGLGVILLAAGAKLGLIQLYGTDQPYADQWAAEGMYFLRGPLYYKIDLVQLTALHGEHRPALTRLWLRGLISANEGQWDCYVELVANLLIYAAFLAAAWRWLGSLLSGTALMVAAASMAVLFGLPCAYENFLWGFQSQFLFLLLCSFLHLYGAVGERRVGARWWLAHGAGFLGLFSIAAGAMSAAALVGLALLECIRGRRSVWVWSTLILNLLLLGFGLWLLPEIAVPEGGRLVQFGRALLGTGYLLSWPFSGFGWCLLLQAPWVGLLIGSWRRSENTQAFGDWKIGAMGLWVAGIAFAIAYGRVLTSDNIGVRYYDVLILGLFVNVVAMVRIVFRQTAQRRWWWGGVALVWILGIAVGLWNQNRPADLAGMFSFQRDLAIEQRQVVRDFLVTNDSAKLQEFENTSHRFPHFQTTLDFLRDPKVPALLPPSLTPDGHANRLSRLTRMIAAAWPFVLGLGLLFALVGAVRVKQEGSRPTPVS